MSYQGPRAVGGVRVRSCSGYGSDRLRGSSAAIRRPCFELRADLWCDADRCPSGCPFNQIACASVCGTGDHRLRTHHQCSDHTGTCTVEPSRSWVIGSNTARLQNHSIDDQDRGDRVDPVPAEVPAQKHDGHQCAQAEGDQRREWPDYRQVGAAHPAPCRGSISVMSSMIANPGLFAAALPLPVTEQRRLGPLDGATPDVPQRDRGPTLEACAVVTLESGLSESVAKTFQAR